MSWEAFIWANYFMSYNKGMIKGKDLISKLQWDLSEAVALYIILRQWFCC